MSISISIPGAVQLLMTNPRPIICLDTCDLLDVIRSLAEPKLNQSEVVSQFLIGKEDQTQTVITYLLQHEWVQNVEQVRRQAEDHLREIDERLLRIRDVANHVKIEIPPPSVVYQNLNSAQSLVDFSEILMDRSLMLEKDQACTDRALARVMDRRRPSHRGAIKDSIHLEHYLEFSRQLNEAGHMNPRFFVSSNKADFWEGPPQLHRDLRGEFDAVGLQFAPKLEVAIGRLEKE